MKVFVSTLAFVLFYCASYAQSTADKKAVRAVINKMDEAWNAHDYTYSGKYDFYAADARLINPVGMYWKNRGEIIKAHRVLGESMFRYSSAKSKLVDLRFLTPAVALATINIQYRFEQPFDTPEGKAYATGDLDHAIMNIVFARHHGTWKIVSQQVTSFDPKVQAYDPVKQQATR